MVPAGSRVKFTKSSSVRLPFSSVPNPTVKQGLSAACIATAAYVFVLSSRASEVLGLGSLKIPALLLIAALLATFTRMLVVPASRMVQLYVALSFWLIVAMLGSVWRGGSFAGFMDVWVRSVAVFFAVAYTCATARDCSFVAVSSACGFLFLGGYTAIFGKGMGSRIGGGTSTSDPNYVALGLLIAIPLFFYALGSARNAITKLFWFAAIGASFGVFLLTGSRGGIIGLAVMVLVWFFRAAARERLVLLLCGGLAFSAALMLLPRTLLERYTSMAQSSNSPKAKDEGAESSTEARKFLFWQSVRLTLQHPVLGVGPFAFMIAEDSLAKNSGFRKGGWHETHNMYTQMSSEAGVPALLLFVMILWTTVRDLYRSAASLRNARGSVAATTASVAQLSQWLLLSMVGLVAAGAFLSVAYASYIPIVAGLSVALQRLIHQPARTQPVPARIVPSQRRSLNWRSLNLN